MKTKFYLKTILLLWALIAGSVGTAWADNNVSTVATTFSATGDVTSKFNQTGDINNVSWNLDVTWKSGYSWQAMNASKGSQIGSGSKPASAIVLTGSNISGTITSVKVNSSVASGGSTTVSVSVGGTAFSCNDAASATLQTSAADYEFTGSGTGDVVLSWSQPSTSKAIYIKSVTITYTASGGSSLNDNDLALNASKKTFDLKNGANQTFQLTNSGSADGALSFESDNSDVATVSEGGLITAVGEGTATITVTQEESATYNGGTATCEVTVIDSRYSVSDLTFEEKCGGSGTADDGAEWTVTSDAEESTFAPVDGIHYGTGSASVTYLQLATSDIEGQVSKIVVRARDAQEAATISVTVGGVAFTCSGSTTVTNTSSDFTFTGTSSGEIIVRIARDTYMTKAIYVKSVKVTYRDVAVKAPIIDVASEFVGSTVATITCATEGATIYYSYDNTTWTEYTEGLAITITETNTIYAKAVKDNDESEVVSKTTTKVLPTPTVTIDATGITNTNVHDGTVAGSLAATVFYATAAVEGATVTWSGNNDEVATIDASTGEVTLVGAGSVTFTATYAGNSDYAGATATYEMTVTNVDPNAPGTENNPYTVVQALENTPSSGNSAEVYVSGIVSGFYNNGDNILSDNSHRYYISDDGSTNDHLLVYNGKGLNNAAFSNADDLLIGDMVVIKGQLTTYQGTKEFAKDNQIVSLMRKPSVPTFSPAAGAVASGTQVTISCTTEGATIYYTTDGTTPTTESAQFDATFALTVTEATTIKAIAVKDNLTSDVATAAYTIALPVATPTFTPAEGTYSSVQNVTISCTTEDATIYYSFDSETWVPYSGAIVVDETTAIYAKAEKEGMVASEVASATYTIEIPSIVFDGQQNPMNIAYTAGETNVHYVASYTTGTITLVLCDANGDPIGPSPYDWLTPQISSDVYVHVTWQANEDTENARTTYFKLKADNVESEVFRITQAAGPVNPAVAGVGCFVKVTNTDDITAGNYLIVYEEGEVAFNGGLSTLDVASNTIAVKIEDNKIPANGTTVAATFTIQPSDKSLKSASGLYIGVSSNSNGLKQTDKSNTYPHTFAIDEYGNAVIAAYYEESIMTLRFNKASNQDRFRYYKSSGQEAIQLYKYDATVSPTFDVVTLNPACTDGSKVYGTYSTTSAFVVPDDLTVSEIELDAEGKLIIQDYAAGAVVPANTGVLVSAAEGGDYVVNMTSEVGTSVLGAANCLRPTGSGIIADDMAALDANSKFYRLTMHNGTDIGFWWGAADGAAFDVAPNKAYLALPATAAVRSGYSWTDETTGIGAALSEIENDGAVYDLQGRRVSKPASGLYIKNGKKVVVK